MEAEVKKLREQLQELAARLARQEQRVMSIEREVAEQAFTQTQAQGELYAEPLLQRARNRQTFYNPKKQTTMVTATKTMGIVVGIGFVVWCLVIIIT